MKSVSTLGKTLLAAALGLGISAQALGGVIYSENFDDGAADGFTLAGLWHVTSNFPASAPNALGYVQNETPNSSVPDGDYDIGDVTGTSFGPAISIPLGGATLSFNAFVGDEFDAEPNIFDRFSVWASPDGVSLGTVLASSQPSAGGVPIPEWAGPNDAVYHPITVDLAPFAGSAIYLAFRFEPFDEFSNGYPGVRVDDIVVSGAAIPEPATLGLMGLGLAGLGWMRRRKAA